MTFDQSYIRLNKAQKQAVDTVDGPVMVVAGPGTGKTSILTLRIANILRRTDTKSEQILALTFTDSGVQSMRSKLVEIIGAEAYKVNIYTFHGFANMLIKKHPDAFPRIIGSKNAGEIEKASILENIIDNGDFEILRPYGDPHYYVWPIINAIKHLKREYISAVDFETKTLERERVFSKIEDLYYESGAHVGKMKGKYIKEEKDIRKNKELCKVYFEYEKKLAEERLYDFEDMLLELVKALKNDNNFLLELQEEYQYILADEHQDANNTQNTIIELLANFHPNPNLFVVGDEKQAIFRFQGASLENFLYFKNLYPDVVLVNLSENYRSTQSILDASHSLIEKNETKGFDPVRLKTNSKHASLKILLADFEDTQQERDFVSGKIKQLIDEGVEPKEILVLYRKNSEGDELAEALESRGVPYSVVGDKDMLGDPEIKKLILILRAIDNLGDDFLLGEIMFFDIFDLPLVSCYEALRESRVKRIPLLSVLSSVVEFEGFVQLISELSVLAKNKDILRFFQELFQKVPYMQGLLKDIDFANKLSLYENFITEIKNFTVRKNNSTLSDFLLYLEKSDKYRVRIKTDVRKDDKSVSLMTAHKSKGLEFEYVFITGVGDKSWGNTPDRSSFDLPFMSSSHIDDERRLFYVALTRAKKGVILSYSGTPSQFIHEIDPELIEKVDHSLIVPQKFANIKSFSQKRVNKFFEVENLRKIFLSENFSVSALNNFIKCPSKYFFNNLLRLPQIQTRSAAYGTAVHAALNTLFAEKNKTSKLDKNELLENFKTELSKLPISGVDYEESLKKGLESLDGYFEMYKSVWERNVLCEYSVNGVQVQIPSTDLFVTLRGFIDKIELSKDKNVEQDIRVVDYKTSKPKSRNEIEGKTASSNGDYKRQLVFYKFLLEDSIYNVNTGEIDFVEPNEKGIYKKELFDITDEDVSELKTLLSQTLKEIYAFEFIGNGCAEKDCEECKLMSLIKN